MWFIQPGWLPDIQLNSPIPDEEIEDAYNHYFKADIPPVIQYVKGISSSLQTR